MSDWSKPTLTSNYSDFVAEVKGRDDDLAKQFDGTTSPNVPSGTIKWNSSNRRHEKWNGSAWVELVAKATTAYAIRVEIANDADRLGGQLPSYYTDIPARLGYTPLSLGGGDMSGRIRMGIFQNSTANNGEAWIGRASDRSAGTMTVQLGSGVDRVFEVVDNAWSIIILNVGMNSFNYKGHAVLHAGNFGGYAMPLSGGTLTGEVVSRSGMTAWNQSIPGTQRGNVHIGVGSSTASSGGAITFGSRDHSDGLLADAGIYIVSDGSYGTRMFLATTDSYATGARNAVAINEFGVVNVLRGALQQQGNQVLHAGNFTGYTANRTAGGYLTPGNWVQFDGTYGLYWPGQYGTHFHPSGGSFGNFQVSGAGRNGYDGLWFNNSDAYLMVQGAGGSTGFYWPSWGWGMYCNSAGIYNGNYGWLHDKFFHTVANCAGQGTASPAINCYGGGDLLTGYRHELIDNGGQVQLRTVNYYTNCNCNCDCG